MTKFRIIFEVEYDVDDESLEEVYGTNDLDEALAIDVANAEDIPEFFVNMGNVRINGEIV